MQKYRHIHTVYLTHTFFVFGALAKLRSWQMELWAVSIAAGLLIDFPLSSVKRSAAKPVAHDWIQMR